MEQGRSGRVGLAGRLAPWLAVAGALLLVMWHVVPVYEETRYRPPFVEYWEDMFGWQIWLEIVREVIDAPSKSLDDIETWLNLMLSVCLACGVLGGVGFAVVVWFGVPRILRWVMAVALTVALAGGPGLLGYLLATDPPDPDSVNFLPTFWLWPAGMVVAWGASWLWAVAGGGDRRRSNE